MPSLVEIKPTGNEKCLKNALTDGLKLTVGDFSHDCGGLSRPVLLRAAGTGGLGAVSNSWPPATGCQAGPMWHVQLKFTDECGPSSMDERVMEATVHYRYQDALLSIFANSSDQYSNTM